MLRITDGDIENSSHDLMIQEGGRKIKKAKGKMTIKYKGKGKLVLGTNSPKIKVSANSDCYFSNNKSHWKRNCPKNLEDLKSGRVSEVSVSGINVIEVNIATSLNDLVLGTRSCAHIR